MAAFLPAPVMCLQHCSDQQAYVQSNHCEAAMLILRFAESVGISMWPRMQCNYSLGCTESHQGLERGASHYDMASHVFSPRLHIILSKKGLWGSFYSL